MRGEDPSLDVPDLPALDRGLGSIEFPLCRSIAPGDDRAFTLVGAGLRARGRHARGLDELATAAGPVLARLRAERAIARGSLRTPIGVERRLRSGSVPLVERLVLARAGPVCFLEWRSEAELVLTLRWVLPVSASVEPRWRTVDRGLLVAAGQRRTLVAFSTTPRELTVEALPDDADPGLAATATFTLAGPAVSPADGLRMAVAALDGGAGARVLRVMGRPHVVVPGARAEAGRVLEARLAVEASDAALGPAVSWAALRLAAGSASGHARPGERAHRRALAALAAGDPAPARGRIGAMPPFEDSAETARYLILVARYLAWTGDRGTVKGVWEAVRAAVAGLAEGADDGGLQGRALAGLVDTAEDVGDAELVGRLRQLGGDAAEAGPADPDPPPGVELIEAVVHGLLAVEPDAPRGRIVLRPRLPAGWDRLVVRNLVVGPSAVELEYARSGARHRFTLRQRRGGAPLRVVLEPELPGQELVAARVDGQAAALEAAPIAGRLRVPLQVVLDHDRTVEVEIRPSAG